MNKNFISGCIISGNAKSEIENAINSLKSFCDEVIVIDGGSTDGTPELAESLGAKVFYRRWDNDYGAQRNFAIEKSQGEWIFMLDTDEVVSPRLVKIIPELIAQNDADGFQILRKNFIDYTPVKSTFAIEPQLRLFRRYGIYSDKIHEKPLGLQNVVKPNYDEDQYIYHYKSAAQQKEHLLYQKGVMEKNLEIAKSRKDQNEIDRLERNLKNWQIWWEDANV